MPDETTILSFRHLLEKNNVSQEMFEHPFRILKRQFGHTKVRYKGLVKNTAQLTFCIECLRLGNANDGSWPITDIIEFRSDFVTSAGFPS